VPITFASIVVSSASLISRRTWGGRDDDQLVKRVAGRVELVRDRVGEFRFCQAVRIVPRCQRMMRRRAGMHRGPRVIAAKIRRLLVRCRRIEFGFTMQRIVGARTNEADMLAIGDDDQQISIFGHVRTLLVPDVIMPRAGH
jgi:hypothetical protein